MVRLKNPAKANKVLSINKKVDKSNWFHIAGNDNPASMSLISTEVVEFLPEAKTFHNLKRTIAYVLRFTHNCKRKLSEENLRRTGDLSLEELEKAG